MCEMVDPEIDQRINVAFRHITMSPEPTYVARGRGMGLRRRGLLLCVSAVLVAAVAIVVSNLGSPPPAEASWSKVPTAPDPNAAAVASQTCHIEAGLPLRLMDHRGRTTVALYADNGNDATCDFTVDATGKVVDSVVGQGRFNPEPPASGLDIVGADLATGTGPVMVLGRAPAEATAVKVALANGVTVTASLGGGYYLAWWPNSTQILSIVADGANGQPIAVLDKAAVDSAVPGNR
jgi:hypothetical protein